MLICIQNIVLEWRSDQPVSTRTVLEGKIWLCRLQIDISEPIPINSMFSSASKVVTICFHGMLHNDAKTQK